MGQIARREHVQPAVHGASSVRRRECQKLGGSGGEHRPAYAVQAVAAHPADISRVINTEAIIFPIAQSIITPKINAPVKKFYVNRGQKVKQGQLLAQLENKDLSGAALDNKGAYEQAEAAYNTSVNATLPGRTAFFVPLFPVFSTKEPDAHPPPQ